MATFLGLEISFEVGFIFLSPCEALICHHTCKTQRTGCECNLIVNYVTPLINRIDSADLTGLGVCPIPSHSSCYMSVLPESMLFQERQSSLIEDQDGPSYVPCSTPLIEHPYQLSKTKHHFLSLAERRKCSSHSRNFHILF